MWADYLPNGNGTIFVSIPFYNNNRYKNSQHKYNNIYLLTLQKY